MISTARTCNLILIVLDCLKPISHKKLIEHELEGFGIRLNKQPPQITFRKKDKGGITFGTAVASPKLDLEGGLFLFFYFLGFSTFTHILFSYAANVILSLFFSAAVSASRPKVAILLRLKQPGGRTGGIHSCFMLSLLARAPKEKSLH